MIVLVSDIVDMIDQLTEVRAPLNGPFCVGASDITIQGLAYMHEHGIAYLRVTRHLYFNSFLSFVPRFAEIARSMV